MANKGSEIQIGDGSLHVGDRVVYPNQGICRITGVETKQIAGQNWEVVTLSREEDGATVMVPRTKVMGVGLRKVANVDAIEEVFDYFAAPGDDPQLDWKVRHRENADKMTGGGLFGTVEVLKGLHALSRVRPLPQKERELYDSARHLIVGEIAAAMNVPVAVAENNLDYALFPPAGMKRKGKELAPAAIPATGPIRRGGDDDLGFGDEGGEEEGEAEEAAPVGRPASPQTEDEDEEGEDRPAPAPSALPRPAPTVRPPAAAAARAPAPPRRPSAPPPPKPAEAAARAPPRRHAAEAKVAAAPARPSPAPTAPRPASARPAPRPAKTAVKKESPKARAAKSAAKKARPAARRKAAKKAAPKAKTKIRGKR